MLTGVEHFLLKAAVRPDTRAMRLSVGGAYGVLATAAGVYLYRFLHTADPVALDRTLLFGLALTTVWLVRTYQTLLRKISQQ